MLDLIYCFIVVFSLYRLLNNVCWTRTIFIFCRSRRSRDPIDGRAGGRGGAGGGPFPFPYQTNSNTRIQVFNSNF